MIASYPRLGHVSAAVDEEAWRELRGGPAAPVGESQVKASGVIRRGYGGLEWRGGRRGMPEEWLR